MFDETKIQFRKLELVDLPLIHQWRNELFVKEWYGRDEDTTIEAIQKKYSPYILGAKPTQSYIAMYETVPVGYIQTYKIIDYPEYAQYVNLPQKTAGVDLYIGNSNFFGKSFGSLMLRKFLKDIVFNSSDTDRCIVGPEPTNVRAIKSYEKVGFKYLKTVKIPNEPNPEYIMVIEKGYS